MRYQFFFDNIFGLSVIRNDNVGKSLSFILIVFFNLANGLSPLLKKECVFLYYIPVKKIIISIECAITQSQYYYLFFFLLCYSLPSGMSVGRSNIKQVADKRRADIEKFLVSLFKMAPEISQSDLVYTFFHPLLRDQQNADIHLRKVKGIPIQ